MHVLPLKLISFVNLTIEISGDESIVILGRRQGTSHETELEFVECVGDVVASGNDGINVIPEETFLDEMFPFLSPELLLCALIIWSS